MNANGIAGVDIPQSVKHGRTSKHRALRCSGFEYFEASHSEQASEFEVSTILGLCGNALLGVALHTLNNVGA